MSGALNYEDVFLAARHVIALVQDKLRAMRAKAGNTGVPSAVVARASKALLEALSSISSVVRASLLDVWISHQRGGDLPDGHATALAAALADLDDLPVEMEGTGEAVLERAAVAAEGMC